MTAAPTGGRTATRSGASVAVGVAVVTLIVYLGWLGWHTVEETPGASSGAPSFEPWQVVGLVLSLVVLVVVAAWWLAPLPVALGAATGLVVTWSADAATQVAFDASLWPVGAAFLAIATYPCAFVLAFVSHALSRFVGARGRGSETPSATGRS